MSISSSYDPLRDLTTFTVTGELTYEAQMDALRDFYAKTPSDNVIWDFRKIDGSRISSDEVGKIISFIQSQRHRRKKGKTALVAGTDLDFGLSRIGESFADASELPWRIRALRSMEEALAWIEEP